METKRTMLAAVVAAFLTLTPALLAQAGALSPVEQLGKQMFFDKISDPSWVACATCHGPETGWTGVVAGINRHGAVYRGAVPQRFGNRKPPTVAYAPFSPVFHYDAAEGLFVGGNFWDGRATGEILQNPAAHQALGPFLNPVEQNMPNPQAVCLHVMGSGDAQLFEDVWGPNSLDCTAAAVTETYGRIGLSIAAYEASKEVSPFDSKFDAYLAACGAAGNTQEDCGLGLGSRKALDPGSILSAKEFQGLTEFGKYCSQCHISVPGANWEAPFLTDFTYDNIGTPRNPENPFYRMDKVYLDDGSAINPLGDDWIDYGLGAFLRTRPEWAALAAENDGKLKVPTVRNVDQRPGKGFPKAYMHNGVFKTLDEVVHFYNTRDVAAEHWPPPEVGVNVNHEDLSGAPMGNLGLSMEQEHAIVEFMRTLTDGFNR